MTITTGVPPSLRNPQTFHRFSFIPAGNTLAQLAQTMVLIGTFKGGTAVAGQMYPVEDAAVTDATFGIGVPLALMARAALAQQSLMQRGAKIYAIPVAENAAGAARTQTFTLTGTATVTDVLLVNIAGRVVAVSVNLGDTAAVVATALNAAINAQNLSMPGTSGVAGAVATFTASTKGVWGQSLLFSVDKVPAGLTCVTASGTPGSGAQDETAALAATLGRDWDVIALENHDTTSVALALSHVTLAWGASEKKWRIIVYGENGSIGVATPLASAANDKAIVVGWCERQPILPFEISAALGAAISGQNRPNANWDRQQLALPPPPDVFFISTTQKEVALAAGITPLAPVIDQSTRSVSPNRVEIVKAVTTQTTLSGQLFELVRDLAVPRAAAFMARQIDVAFAQRFSANADNPDGALLDDDAIPKVRDMITALMYAAQDAKVIKNVAADLAKLVLELDPNAPGRINCSVTYTVVVGLHQAAFIHRVTVGG